MDLKVIKDPTSPSYGDLLFKNGTLTKEEVTHSLKETVAQRLRIRLLTFKGEWFLSEGYGVPYYQEILGKKPRKSRIDQIFQQQILAEQGVREITQFSSSFQNRQYSASFKVRVSGGEETETITLGPVE